VLFTELRFAVFFALAFGVSWLLKRNGLRKAWLLVCSYFFYAAWDWRFLSLIVLSTAIDFVAARAIDRLPEGPARRAWLVVSLAANLGILGFFKYWNFFVASGAGLFSLLGLGWPVRTLEIVLPVGISFFTFQSMSYTIDVYRRKLHPVRSPLDFALFVGFFPQLVAGPIVRAREFLPQLASAPVLRTVAGRRYLWLLLVGFVKKACVADHLALAVDPVFASPVAYGAGDHWLALALYHAQIYCDFSGYTDMAIASAGLLGYRLVPNFAFPYLAGSVRAFWRRWHISLSTWFRDYLFVPLGGSRASAARTARNLWAVFLLCGLWHGASWTFVLWGSVHGALSTLERGSFGRRIAALPLPLRLVYLNLAVMSAWVLFRAQDLGAASTFAAGLTGLAGPPSAAIAHSLQAAWWLALPALAAVHGAAWWGTERGGIEILTRPPLWAFSAAYGAAWAVVLPFVATRHQPFIYFQF
jgi:alginate O-acetyltransferase complex protein AlgI